MSVTEQHIEELSQRVRVSVEQTVMGFLAERFERFERHNPDPDTVHALFNRSARGLRDIILGPSIQQYAHAIMLLYSEITVRELLMEKEQAGE